MAITQITNNIILDGTILPAKLNVSASMRAFLDNATSANLAGAVSGTTGSGNLVFDTNPTFTDTATISSTGWSYMRIIRGNTSSKTAVSFQTSGVLNSTTPLWEFGITNGFSDFHVSTWNGSVLTQRIAIMTDGRFAIGTTSPNASAMLQIDSTTRGFLPPRMTSTQRNAISSPASGLVVYSSDIFNLSLYNGTAWGDVLTTHSTSFTSDTLRNAVTDPTGTGALVFADGSTLSNLNIASLQQPSLNLIRSNQSITGSPAAAFFDDFLGNTTSDLNWEISSAGGNDSNGPVGSTNVFGLLQINTSATAGIFRQRVLRAGATLVDGAVIEACFAIPDFSGTYSMIMGLQRPAAGRDVQVVASPALNGGNWSFANGNGINTQIVNSSPSSGNFITGKKYRVRIQYISTTLVNIRILEADAGLANWSIVFSGDVVTAVQDRGEGVANHGTPKIGCSNGASGGDKSLIIDWFSYYNPNNVR